MNHKDRQTVYENTGATVYYNKVDRIWCALWLGDGFEHKVLFRAGVAVEMIIDEVLKRKTQTA